MGMKKHHERGAQKEVSLLPLAKELFPICRSITGNGVRETLKILQREIPDLTIHQIPSGTKCFDWEIPKEWNIRDAYIKNSKGEKIVDFQKSNLHVIGYSTKVNKKISLQELKAHLHSLPDLPDAIPYITSYYSERWGFCLTHNQLKSLIDDEYTVHIDSSLENGVLNYGEVILKGNSEKEIFLSCYICHPSMANNELSGPVVMTRLTQWLRSLDRNYTYRIIFTSETIGSIAYLSQNLNHLRKNVIAAFNLTCIGDENDFSYITTPYADTYTDELVKNHAKYELPKFTEYSYLERGSDERQYCSPGVRLPLVTVMRTKFSEFKEYHTSLDNFDLVTEEGLQGGLKFIMGLINTIEKNRFPKVVVPCEPQLGKRGLYPNLSTRDTKSIVKDMMNVLAYSDGSNSLIEISNLIQIPVPEVDKIVGQMEDNGLIESIKYWQKES